jgi:hypothetical protein
MLCSVQRIFRQRHVTRTYASTTTTIQLCTRTNESSGEFHLSCIHIFFFKFLWTTASRICSLRAQPQPAAHHAREHARSRNCLQPCARRILATSFPPFWLSFNIHLIPAYGPRRSAHSALTRARPRPIQGCTQLPFPRGAFHENGPVFVIKTLEKNLACSYICFIIGTVTI